MSWWRLVLLQEASKVTKKNLPGMFAWTGFVEQSRSGLNRVGGRAVERTYVLILARPVVG